MNEKRVLTVYKSNELIENFVYNLGSMEWDIFDYLISQIKNRKQDVRFSVVNFSAKEFFKEVYGKKKLGGKDYKEFRGSIEKILSAQAWVIEKEGEYKGYETNIRLVDKVYIDPNSADWDVALILNDDLLPYLLNFSKEKPYTKFLLKNKVNLRSKYAKRLYEILKSKENLAYGIYPPGLEFLPLEEFKNMLNIPETYRFALIKARILDGERGAIREISDNTDIECFYSTKTTGKKVTGIKFQIKKKKQSPTDFIEADFCEKNEDYANLRKLIGFKANDKREDMLNKKIGICLIKMKSIDVDKDKAKIISDLYNVLLDDSITANTTKYKYAIKMLDSKIEEYEKKNASFYTNEPEEISDEEMREMLRNL